MTERSKLPPQDADASQEGSAPQLAFAKGPNTSPSITGANARPMLQPEVSSATDPSSGSFSNATVPAETHNGDATNFKFDSNAPPPEPVPDPLIGRTIDGRYVIERVLGEGGMGIVYAGRHRIIDKRVAIKVLRVDFTRDKEITDRFLQEAKAASSIGNPHIVDISDFGTLPDGAAYFVMEFLDGESLSQALERTRPMPVERVTRLARQIAQGLSAAHAAGIVHRDLKPDNVIVVKRGTDQDFAKILDFGIAKVSGETARITRAGSVFGTPHYMSPEQAAGAQVDQRTDIYALGVILYELASGRVPFDADNFMGILTQHMYSAPTPMLALVPQPNVPPGLDAIVMKCLSKKPDGRYRSMDEFAADLDLLEKGAQPNAVGELMARSDGLHFSADASNAHAAIRATPSERRSKTPIFVAIAAAATIALVVVGGVMKTKKTAAIAPMSSTPIASSSTSPTAAAVASNSAPAQSSETNATAPTKLVLIGTDPIDAHITRDGVDLGTPPVALEIPETGQVTLTVTRMGFVPQKLTVDAKSPKQLVKLIPNVKAASHAKPKGTGTPTQQPIDGFSDPFIKH